MNKRRQNFKSKVNALIRRFNWARRQNYYFYMRNLESFSGAKVRINGRQMIMLGSNNYLGLTSHPKVKEAAIKAVKKYGVGSGGVRMLSGTFRLHEELEREIAEFKGTESSVIFNTGFMTNLGSIISLVDKNTVVINDEKNHASIVDGSVFSRAQIRVFLHNDMQYLEKILSSYPNTQDKLIIVDSVYSMDGDIANLPDIYRLARKYKARIMIDEAHASGVLGMTGRGAPEYFNMIGTIDIVMGTLSKALGGLGGFIASTEKLVTYLKHVSREFIFSTSLPPAIVAGNIAAIKVIRKEPHLIRQLWRNIRYMKEELEDLGYDTGNSESAIIPVLIWNEIKTYKMAHLLDKAGIFVNPVVFPAVKESESRLRVSIMALHSLEDLDRALEAFKKAGRKLGII
ncbi:MAG: aminotransferase class I/II-fold pyridoxal phosphate-dependent enzyme [Candidatus Omnitrophica bacterium]|nr:aminotransferase class I/II-fold pyridoxal phosphate-dependent enzyme [Candidatus Omnitrophota bacterium]